MNVPADLSARVRVVQQKRGMLWTKTRSLDCGDCTRHPEQKGLPRSRLALATLRMFGPKSSVSLPRHRTAFRRLSCMCMPIVRDFQYWRRRFGRLESVRCDNVSSRATVSCQETSTHRRLPTSSRSQAAIALPLSHCNPSGTIAGTRKIMQSCLPGTVARLRTRLCKSTAVLSVISIPRWAARETRYSGRL